MHADIEYLDFKVGKRKVKAVEAKLKDILNLPPPTNRRGCYAVSHFDPGNIPLSVTTVMTWDTLCVVASHVVRQGWRYFYFYHRSWGQADAPSMGKAASWKILNPCT